MTRERYLEMAGDGLFNELYNLERGKWNSNALTRAVIQKHLATIVTYVTEAVREELIDEFRDIVNAMPYDSPNLWKSE